eukprot:23689-Eustigmatos_ZCMA.PRE.1
MCCWYWYATHLRASRGRSGASTAKPSWRSSGTSTGAYCTSEDSRTHYPIYIYQCRQVDAITDAHRR